MLASCALRVTTHGRWQVAWPPYHPWLRVGPLLVRAGGRRLAAGGVARFPYVGHRTSYQDIRRHEIIELSALSRSITVHTHTRDTVPFTL